MRAPLFIDTDFIEANSSYHDLIPVLNEAFGAGTTVVPQCHHHDFPNPGSKKENTLLLMPAYNPGEDLGIKAVTINPQNNELGLPSVQGTYLYMDASNGQLKAVIEAKNLTAKRTAATSALASKYLSRKDASSLLMIGTGALSINLIKAHASVRRIRKVFVWGRNEKKSDAIVGQLQGENFSAQVVPEIGSVISQVDIVSCATLAKNPLVFGADLVPGQHLDLVGAYKIDMREADDEVMRKATVYLVSYEGGLRESGDIVIPLEKGIINKEDIVGDLFELCANKKKGRVDRQQITLFKSVGHALEDLVAARYYYEKFMHENV